MNYVGIPQACEAIAIDLEDLSRNLRRHAQAIRRIDLNDHSTLELVRAGITKSQTQLAELLAMFPEVEEDKPKKKGK